MKSTTTGSFQKTSIDTRARYSFNTSLVLTIAFIPGVFITLYLAQTTKIWQLFIISAVAAITSILSILAMRFSRQKRVEAATFLMITGIILIVPTITIFLSGVGLLLGIAGFIAIFMIAGLTLIQPNFTWATVSGIVLGITTILLDIFYPLERLEVRSITTFLSIAAVIAITFFSYYISQQFTNYPLRNKLILLFIIVVFFSVGSVAIITNRLIRNEVTKQVGQNQQALAERLAFETGENLDTQVENLLASGTQFKEIAEAASSSYTGSDREIVDQILKLDQEWIIATDQSTLIRDVVDNETADKLREFQELFPNHVELFLTDKYGANIASTNRTSDYYQADEDWWMSTYNLGKGSVFIDQPEFDESSQTYAVNIAVPIYSNEQVVGILRSTYDATAILSILRQGAVGGTKEIDLRLPQDTLLTGEPISRDELTGLSTVQGNYGEITYKGRPSLVSQKRVFSSEFGAARQAILQLGWSVIGG
jgi:hypothetical protein